MNSQRLGTEQFQEWFFFWKCLLQHKDVSSPVNQVGYNRRWWGLCGGIKAWHHVPLPLDPGLAVSIASPDIYHQLPSIVSSKCPSPLYVILQIVSEKK